MSYVDLEIQYMGVGGLEPVMEDDLDDTDIFRIRNDGRTFLYVVNGDTDVVVTITGGSSPTVTCTANEERMIGPFPPAIYNDAYGDVLVTIDDDSNVELAAIRVGLA